MHRTALGQMLNSTSQTNQDRRSHFQGLGSGSPKQAMFTRLYSVVQMKTRNSEKHKRRYIQCVFIGKMNKEL